MNDQSGGLGRADRMPTSADKLPGERTGRPGSPGSAILAAPARIGGTGTPVRRIWRLSRPSWVRLLATVALAAGALLSSVGLLVVSAWLISRASQHPPVLYLQIAIVSVRAFGISRGVLRYAERLVGHDAALRSLVGVRVAVYERLERLSPAGLGRHRRGDLLARMVGDVDTTVDLVVRVVVPALAGALASLVAVTIGWALLPAGGIALLVAVLVGGVLAPTVTSALGTRARRARAEAEGALSAELVATLDAAAELRAFGVADEALDRIAAADARLTSLDRRAAVASGLGSALSALATGLGLVACLWLGASAVRAGTLDGVWLAALVLLPLALADVLAVMIPAALARAGVAGAAERILEVLDAPDPVPAGTSGAGIDAAQPPAADSREDTVHDADPAAVVDAGTSVGHGVEARDGDRPGALGAVPTDSTPTPASAVLTEVTARYPESFVDAVAELDLDLSPGRRVAVVGPSGSGKSTAVAVLLRLLDHRSGSYTLSGTDVRELPEDVVRTTVGALDQNVHLFDSTIEENLLLARRDATDEKLRAALDAAGLSEWTHSLPDGLRTRVGTRGAHVSGGEAQRIGLARLLLADRPVVLLDEPGEHLDVAAADRVTRAAMAAVEGRTVLLVTHRMTHTQTCDEVVVLDAGRVVERAAPEELGGWYADALLRERGPVPPRGGDREPQQQAAPW